jgi:uncharacterized protein (DUF4415 family)
MCEMKDDYDFSKGRRGALRPVAIGKTRITIRIDDDILDWFRAQVHDAGGGSYQSLVNDALRAHMTTHKQPLETVLRRVVREELKRAKTKRKAG